jgi:hypothetical protein
VEVTGARSDDAVHARIDMLRRVVAGRTALSSQYADLAGTFALRFADVPTYQTRTRPDAKSVAAMVRDRLNALGPALSLSVVPGTEETAGGGIGRLPIDVSMTTGSDRAAIEALKLFSRPETGLAWQTVSVAADRQEHRVTVTGKVIALVVGPVE